jgi:hypothetical protein
MKGLWFFLNFAYEEIDVDDVSRCLTVHAADIVTV